MPEVLLARVDKMIEFSMTAFGPWRPRRRATAAAAFGGKAELIDSRPTAIYESTP
jgi:hypothetical protein